MGSFSGCPIQVIVPSDNHTFHLDETALNRILSRPDLTDKKLILISLAGVFRKGKSFFLDFILRYLQANSADDETTWLGDDCQELTGFHWCGGSDRDTTGIWLWSEPFIRTLPTGEEVAILLMDTQGSCNPQSTAKESVTIFALSTLLSSVQIYNLANNIQEDDLPHLTLFTEYARFAQEREENLQLTPFQKLLFLVRDWNFPWEHQYGLKGGEELLAKKLEVLPGQDLELQAFRRDIYGCFGSLQCYLLPHPGLKAATNPNFTGSLSDMEVDFRENLTGLMSSVFAPENLAESLKQINGKFLTAQDLIKCFKSYMEIYPGDTIPDVELIYEASVGVTGPSVGNSAIKIKLESIEEDLAEERLIAQALAREVLESIEKIKREEFSRIYRQNLQQELEQEFGTCTQGAGAMDVLMEETRRPSYSFIHSSIVFI